MSDRTAFHRMGEMSRGVTDVPRGSTSSDKRTAPARVAIINSHPVQYFGPLYTYLNAAEDIEVTVFYCTDMSLRPSHMAGFGKSFSWDIDLLSGYDSIFLNSRPRKLGGFFSLVVPEVWGVLRSGKYDAVIIHGHSYAVCWLVLAAAKVFGIRSMMRGDTHLGLERSGWRRALRKPIIGTFYRLFDRFLAVGSSNAAFYRALGVPAERISIFPYAVDNDRFSRESQLSDDERLHELSALGIPADRPIVLFASKFQPRKRPDDVLRAAAELIRRGVDFTLLLVGDGPTRPELERFVVEMRMDNVVFAGFINQSRLPTIYGICDVFVLPSMNEPWGLVVNEVMCAGKPVVVSKEIGCVPDLVVHGENGFLFSAGDVSGLANALQPLLTDPQLRKRMGDRSREIIGDWGYQQCLEGLRDALRDL